MTGCALRAAGARRGPYPCRVPGLRRAAAGRTRRPVRRGARLRGGGRDGVRPLPLRPGGPVGGRLGGAGGARRQGAVPAQWHGAVRRRARGGRGGLGLVPYGRRPAGQRTGGHPDRAAQRGAVRERGGQSGGGPGRRGGRTALRAHRYGAPGTAGARTRWSGRGRAASTCSPSHTRSACRWTPARTRWSSRSARAAARSSTPCTSSDGGPAMTTTPTDPIAPGERATLYPLVPAPDGS
ncbi:hypothetical protein SSPIM334S_01314 [Streptomyces spiroverticillatus]